MLRMVASQRLKRIEIIKVKKIILTSFPLTNEIKECTEINQFADNCQITLILEMAKTMTI
jgi:hypothetical protein